MDVRLIQKFVLSCLEIERRDSKSLQGEVVQAHHVSSVHHPVVTHGDLARIRHSEKLKIEVFYVTIVDGERSQCRTSLEQKVNQNDG